MKENGCRLRCTRSATELAALTVVRPGRLKKSFRFITIALCVCLQALQARALSAQELKCNELKPLPGSKSGYQRRGNRCEGLYVTDAGAEAQGLTLTSLTLGKLRFDLRPQSRLQVSAPDQTEQIHLRAVAIPPKTYYRMDASLPRGAVLVWPVGDVLLPESLDDSRIGIVGWKGTGSNKTLVLVDVVNQGAKEVGGATTQPLLIIQPSFDAGVVKWRWARAQNGTCLSFGTWQDAIKYPITANSPVSIKLSQLPSGLDCVEAAAQSGTSNAWRTLKLRIEVPAR